MVTAHSALWHRYPQSQAKFNTWLSRTIWGNQGMGQQGFDSRGAAVQALMNLVAEPEIEYHRSLWTGVLDEVTVTLPGWSENTGYYRITEIDTGLAGLNTTTKVYSNLPEALENGAQALTVQAGDEGGVVTFDTKWQRNKITTVEFWPHGVTEQAFVLTTSREAQ